MGSRPAIVSDVPRRPTTDQPRRLESCPCHQPRSDSFDFKIPFQACSGEYECNICLAKAHDSVVTLCGHLFCWPCLFKWLQISPCQDCPVCRAAVEKEKIVHLQPAVSATKSLCNDPDRPSGQIRWHTPSHSQPDWDFSPALIRGIGAGARSYAVTRGFGGTRSTARPYLLLLPSLLGRQFHEILNFLQSADDRNAAATTSAGRGQCSHDHYISPPTRPIFVDRRQEAALVSKFMFLTAFVVLCLFFL